ncbi:hypothetical protein KFK09_026139 [Dendrobium nobile]|uniref:Uncharacterized protein n=1 Tax=Dendrobium nobile TaxID=94219 RepID=A0A8T3A6X1_DENNO|nr:hypothetical protein KFK09_026139 [Dendrobium nobile]
MPMQLGVLGIPSIDALYHANFCSFLWRFDTSDNLAIWFKSKYLSPWKQPSANVSKFWKLLCSTAQSVRRFISLVISLNSTFSMRWDPWCNGKSLYELFRSVSLGLPYVNCYLNCNQLFPLHFPIS